VDKDLKDERLKFYKANGINPKKGISKDQTGIMLAYDKKEATKVKNLQKYLEDIVNNINKSDSVKWIQEVYNKCYKNMEKMLKKYEAKRASGGRAKIVFLVVVGLVVTGLGVTATILTGGAALPLIVAIAGATLSVATTIYGGYNNYKKTKDFLKQRVATLTKEMKAIDAMVIVCADAKKNQEKDHKKFLKDTGLSQKEYEKFFPKGGADAEILFPKLKEHRKSFDKFAKHLSDIEKLSVKMNVGIKDLKVARTKFEKDYSDALQKLKEGNKDEVFGGKKGPALQKYFKDMKGQLNELKLGIAKEEVELKAVTELVMSARATRDSASSFKKITGNLKATRSSVNKYADRNAAAVNVGGVIKGIIKLVDAAT
jgi:hypothetical protein